MQILFLLPALAIQALAEVALAVEQADSDQRNIEVGRALDVIAGEHAQAARVNRQRFVQPELGREVRHRPRPQNAGMRGAPGAIGAQILLLAAIGVIDAAVQHQLAGAALELRQRNFGQQRDGIVIQLPQTHRIEVAKQAGGIVVPAPPQVAGERPEPLLHGRDEAIQRARFAYHRRHLRGGLHQHLHFVVGEGAGFDGLNHQHALQDALIDQRNAAKRLVGLFARLAEIFETRMTGGMFDGHRPHLLGHQTGQAFVQRHAQRADALRAKSERRGQHQVGAVRLQQVGGANVGLKAPGDQRDDVHQRLGGLAALGREMADLFQRQNVTGSSSAGRLSHDEAPCRKKIPYRQTTGL